MPKPVPQTVLHYADQIENEMRHIGFWQNEPLRPEQLDFEQAWPSIFEQLSREKFRSDVSQLSAKEFELLRRAA